MNKAYGGEQHSPEWLGKIMESESAIVAGVSGKWMPEFDK